MFSEKLLFKSSMLLNGQYGIQVRPPTNSDDLCLFFCLYHCFQTGQERPCSFLSVWASLYATLHENILQQEYFNLVIVLFLLHVFSNGFPEFSLFYLAQQYARPSQKMKIRETVEFLPKNIVLFSRRYRNCLSNITGKIFNYSSESSISIVYSFSLEANGEKYQKARNKTIKKQEWHIIKLLKSRNGA